eukprot:Lankesteria_metandrocarpae@DN2706_c0_g1_i1.p1
MKLISLLLVISYVGKLSIAPKHSGKPSLRKSPESRSLRKSPEGRRLRKSPLRLPESNERMTPEDWIYSWELGFIDLDSHNDYYRFPSVREFVKYVPAHYRRIREWGKAGDRQTRDRLKGKKVIAVTVTNNEVVLYYHDPYENNVLMDYTSKPIIVDYDHPTFLDLDEKYEDGYRIAAVVDSPWRGVLPLIYGASMGCVLANGVPSRMVALVLLNDDSAFDFHPDDQITLRGDNMENWSRI